MEREGGIIMVEIFSKLDIIKNQSSFKTWELEAFRQFESKMSNQQDKFPCIPATLGYHLNHFRYAFLEDPRKEGVCKEFAAVLKLYNDLSVKSEQYSSLVAIFATPSDLLEMYTIEQFEELFWKLLSRLQHFDTKEWPPHISKDPHSNTWEFCFNGEPYFVYCATPKHVMRQSRSFPFFMLAITPRWVLKNFHLNPEHAKKMRKAIRKRIEEYDQKCIHPDLNWYGEIENFEWKQYFLRDDDSTPSACPFHSLSTLKKE